MSNYPDGVSTRDIDRAACGERDRQDAAERELAKADEDEDGERWDGQS